MNVERRYLRFRIDPDPLMAFLRGEFFGVLREFPADASWVTMGWDANYQCLVVVVHSRTFDPVPVGREIPFSDNAPIIQEGR